METILFIAIIVIFMVLLVIIKTDKAEHAEIISELHTKIINLEQTHITGTDVERILATSQPTVPIELLIIKTPEATIALESRNAESLRQMLNEMHEGKRPTTQTFDTTHHAIYSPRLLFAEDIPTPKMYIRSQPSDTCPDESITAPESRWTPLTEGKEKTNTPKMNHIPRRPAQPKGRSPKK